MHDLPPVGSVWTTRVPTRARDYASPRTPPALWPLGFWTRIWLGTALAGGAYGLPFYIIGGAIGLVVAGIVGMLVALPIALCIRTTTGTWFHPLSGPAHGGLTGLLSAMAVLLPPPLQSAIHLDAKQLLLAPVATILMGQLGGYLASRALLKIERRRHLARGDAERRYRFSLRTLLVVTAWATAWLAALRLVGLFEPGRGAVTVISLGVYGCSLAVWAFLLCNRPTARST